MGIGRKPEMMSITAPTDMETDNQLIRDCFASKFRSAWRLPDPE